jgi:hypothetical protein
MKPAMKPAMVLVIVMSVAILAPSSQHSFKLIPSDKSFEITFPSEPRHAQNTSESGPIHVEAHSYSFETSASKFVLSYVILTPSPADLKATDALDSAIGGTVDNVGGKLLAQNSMTMAAHPAKAAVIGVGEKTIIDARFVYVEPRVYQILVLHRNGDTPEFQQQFFDSFSVEK